MKWLNHSASFEMIINQTLIAGWNAFGTCILHHNFHPPVISNGALRDLLLFGDRRVVRNPQRTLEHRFCGYSILSVLGCR